MDKNNSYNSSSTPSKKNSRWYQYLTPLFFSFLIIIIIILLPISILFILIQQNVISFINPNSIYLPEGKILRNLHTITFRNETITRYDGQYIVLDEGEFFQEIEAYDDRYSPYDRTLMTTTEYKEDQSEYEVGCSGTCKCYEGYGDENRRSSSMLYSSRVSSIVVVSILGFAVAQFVNNHIDECYDSARNVLGDDIPFTCAVEECDCTCDDIDKTIDELMFKEGKVDESKEQYRCRGICQFNKVLHDCYEEIPEAQAEMKELKCNEQVLVKIIDRSELKFPDKYASSLEFRHMEDHFLWQFLHFYCLKFRTPSKFSKPGDCGLGTTWPVSPCTAETPQHPHGKFVRCMSIGEMSY